jgi:O-antigen/teichoic acid export membrane protein
LGQRRTKKASKNVFYNLSSQILILVITFISRTFFINAFGVEYLGINGLFSDVLGMLSMADLGFNTAMVFSLYKPLAENDKTKIAGLITFYRKVYLLIAATVTLVGIAIIPLLPYLVKVNRPIPDLWLYYLFALANVVVSYLCVYKTSILSADQKGYIIALVSMGTGIFGMCLQILSILLWSNYIVYLAIGSVVVLTNNLISSAIATKRYPFINSRVQLHNNEKKNIYTNIRSAFIYKVSSVLLNGTTNVIISVIISTAVVGYYSNYLMIQNKIMLLYSSAFAAVTASIGNLIATENAAKKKQIFECEQSISFIFSGIVIPCYIALANDFIKIWLGTDYTLTFAVVTAAGINLYLGCVFQPLWSYRDATGIYQKTKWAMVCCAILNILLSVILGKLLGLFGIVIASSLSRISTYAWFEPKILFKTYFKHSPREYYIHTIQNALFVALLTACILFTSHFIAVNTWLDFSLKALLLAGICTAVSLLLYSRTEGFRILAGKLRGELKERKEKSR